MIDPYESRKLPFIIGTKEFIEDDLIGLADSLTSSIEHTPSSTQNSNSDSEDESDDANDTSKAQKYLPTSSIINVRKLIEY